MHAQPNEMPVVLRLRAQGLTIAEIASEIGRARSTVCRWLNPKNTITGLCECGCGTPTAVNPNTWRPHRFTRGHHTKIPDGQLYVVDAETDCWLWQGSRDSKGYGNLNREGYSSAHRWMYERTAGAIPKGLQIDHLCNNPPCVNPEHMECVTLQENVRRRDARKEAA